MATINGTNGNNILNGTTEDDVIVSRGGADTISGGDGNDVIIIDTAPAGSDTVDGGAGIDIVVLDADYADFTVSEGSGTLILTGLDATTETLTNVEQVVFNDQTIYIVGAGGYPTIQAAVDAAGPGGIILVTEGTYVEQVDITGKTGLTITAVEGADVTIRAPADVVQTATSSSGRALNAVVTVENSTGVVIANITVDGAGAGNSVDGPSANFVGVVYRNASGGLDDVDITGVRDAYPGGTTVGGEPVQSGNQRGVGVQVDNDAPAMGDPLLGFFMEGGSISDFQKNATVFNRADLTINGVTITGGGAQPINAQNGIQVANSTGTISNNIITDIGYAGTQVVYSGMILAFGNTDLDITGNTITGSNVDTLDAQTVGIYVLDFGPDNSGGSITGNTISFVDSAIDVSGDLGPESILISGNIITDIDVTDPFAGGVSFAPNGSTSDTVSGSDAVDFLSGGAGTDMLSGLGGNDVLDGGTGSDTLDGGLGTDTATYAGSVADYSYVIAYDPSGFATGFSSVTHTASGDVDTLTSVEILQFGDATLDLGAPVQLLDADGDLIGTFTTIQGAVDAAGSVVGAVTVLVNDGNYAESVIIDRGDLTLRSVNGRDATTITGVAGAALGTIEIDPGVNNVTIGGTGAGFTIIGLNGNGGIENAAIYLQGAHDNIDVVGNDVVANGDAGLMGEFGQNNSNLLIDGNIFSGQTFDGANPSGTGFGQQFDIGNNVPRQLVVLGSGNNGAVGSNVVFTNNQVTGTAGGISTTTGNPLGNTLVTIDVPGSTISGNDFSGNTTGAGYAIRARSQDTDIENNSLTGDSGGIFVNNGGVPGTYGGNSFTGTAGADVVFAMTDGDDTVTTLDGNDQIGTNGGNDTIDAGAGDDIILAGAGSDSIDGGADIDTAVFATALSGSDVAVTTGPDGRITGFTSVVTGMDTDTLTSIERLQFSDVTLDLTDAVQLFDAGGDLVGTFDTIQAAVDAASDDYVIRVREGSYDEDVTVDVGVTIIGAFAGTAGSDGGRDAAAGVGETTVIGRWTITSATDVTIDGLRFVNDATTTGGGASNPTLGIRTGGDNLGHSITNSIFWSTVAGGANGVDDRAISTSVIGSGAISITDNLISGTSTGAFGTASWGRGIWFDGGGVALSIDDNSMQSTRTAINLDMTGASTAEVTDNIVTNAGTFISGGVDVDGVTVSGNDISNVGTDFNFRNLTSDVTFDASGAIDTVTPVDPANPAVDAVTILGGGGNDNFTGTDGADVLDGNNLNLTAADNDILTGGLGNDLLLGRGGNDTAGYSETVTVADIAAVADANPLVAGDQAGWTVTTSGGTDNLVDIEAVSHAGGRILLVGNGGYDTIQAAVDAANDGDTILVAAGTYTENVTIDVDVTLLGANHGVSGNDVRGAESVIAGTVTLADDGITIDGFTIDGGGTLGSGIRGASSLSTHSDITIDNNILTGQTGQPILMGFGFGGGIGSSNWSVNDNLVTNISGNNATGIVLFNITGLTLTGNTVDHDNAAFTGRRGINLDGIVDGTITGNTVAEGGPTGTSWGIQIGMSDRAASNLTVSDNTVTGSALGIFTLSQRSITDLTISDNDVTGGTTGILVNGGGAVPVAPGTTFTNIVITGNTVDVTGDAIRVRDLHDAAANGPIAFDTLTIEDNDVVNGLVRVGTDGDGLLNLSGTNVVEGDDGNDSVSVEGTGAVTFDAGDGNDSFVGAGANDSFIGGEGDDVVTGGAGSDALDGGNGTDTARFDGPQSLYTVTATTGPDGRVTGFSSITDGTDTDTLTSIEILSFDNGATVIDLADAVQLFDDGGNIVGTFDTIQAAIDAAADNYVIRVAAGSYDEDVTVDVGVTIIGAFAGTAGSDGGRDAAAGTGETTAIGRWTITSTTDVTIDGLRFVNDATTTGGGASNPTLGIRTGGDSAGHSVTNSIFWSTVAGGANGVDDRAISTSVIGSGAISITDNLISGTSSGLFGTAAWGRGIWFDGGGVALTVDGNTTQSTRTAVNVDLTGASTADISNNSFTNAGTGVSVGVDADGLTLADNDHSNVGSDFNFRNLTTDVTFDAGAAIDAVTPADPANDIVVVLGGTGIDTLTGTDGNDFIDGNNSSNQAASDNDVLTGGLGDDVLLGKAGDDTLDGGDGSDTLNGGTGTDTANYAETLATADVVAVADVDPVTAGNQAGWTVTTAGGTDALQGVEILSHAGGTIRLVGNGGYATIQAAVDASVDGDTILIAAGSYAEDVIVDVGVTIVGANGGEAGTGMGRDAANGVGETTIVGNWRITSTADVSIDGLRFVNDATTTGGPSNAPLWVLSGGTTGHSISNSIFWSTISGAANDDRAIQVSPIAAGSVSITDNLISGTQQALFGTASWGRGIWFDGGGVALTVDGNTISWARTAINLDMSGTSTATVSNNDLTNSGTGVSVGLDNDGVTLLNNDISNVGTDFNFRNLTGDVVFDADAAVGGLTSGFGTNDPVIILSGSGNDTITGTEFADVIDGNNNPGNLSAADTDTLSGLAGNDTIFGRFGNDVLNGGADNDTLDGGDGVDALFGEDGTDTLTGGEGNDYLDGGTGADAMTGGNGDDTFIVDDFGDTTSGGAGRDTVRTSTAVWTLAADIEVLAANSANALIGTGNALDNTISGSISADTLSGLDGIDTIFGRAGNDTIIGGEGNDLLYGQENDDTLIGGNGNDYLEGGAGLDIMIGGAGDDIYLASDFGDLVAEQAGEGIDTVRAVNANYTLSANVEILQYFGTGNFIGYGNGENNQVIGGNGNDFLYGIAGNDRLIGGSGNDYLDGGIGADNMSGGLGNDSYIVDDIGDVVGELADQGTDTVQTTLSSYTITANVENLNYVGTGNFTGNGSAVANTIFTQGGNDVVNGLGGNDVISTRAGADVINGGAGRDIMTGGADGDRFVFSSTADTAVGQADRITDFSSAQGDLIDLSAIDAIAGGANNAFTFIGSAAFSNVAGQLRVFTQSGNTFVVGDVNGDGVADFQIQVDGIVPLSGSDFIL